MTTEPTNYLSDILDRLKPEERSKVAEQLAAIIKDYQYHIQADENPDARYRNISQLFEKSADEAEFMSLVVLHSMANMRTVFNIDHEPKYFDLYDSLRNFVKEQRAFAQRVASTGGPRNLFRDLHGPPLWRLAIDSYPILAAHHPKLTRDEFESLCDLLVEVATSDDTSRGSSRRYFREAYRVGRALGKYRKTTGQIRRALTDPKIPDNKRDDLQSQLQEAHRAIAKLNIPYPL